MATDLEVEIEKFFKKVRGKPNLVYDIVIPQILAVTIVLAIAESKGLSNVEIVTKAANRVLRR